MKMFKEKFIPDIYIPSGLGNPNVFGIDSVNCRNIPGSNYNRNLELNSNWRTEHEIRELKKMESKNKIQS